MMPDGCTHVELLVGWPRGPYPVYAQCMRPRVILVSEHSANFVSAVPELQFRGGIQSRAGKPQQFRSTNAKVARAFYAAYPQKRTATGLVVLFLSEHVANVV